MKIQLAELIAECEKNEGCCLHCDYDEHCILFQSILGDTGAALYWTNDQVLFILKVIKEDMSENKGYQCPYCGSTVIFVNTWEGWVHECLACGAQSEPLSSEILEEDAEQ